MSSNAVHVFMRHCSFIDEDFVIFVILALSAKCWQAQRLSELSFLAC